MPLNRDAVGLKFRVDGELLFTATCHLYTPSR